MSNNKWYLLLAAFAAPLIIILMIAYYISFVAFSNVDNTDQLANNLADIHSVLTGEKITNTDEFSADNIAYENAYNNRVYDFENPSPEYLGLSQSTEDRLKANGYEITFTGDANLDGRQDLIAIKPVDLKLTADYLEGFVAADELQIFTEFPGFGLSWPEFSLDKNNFPAALISEDGVPMNNIIGIKQETDPNGRVQFGICPLDHQGNNVAQCFSLIWDPKISQYDFYCCDKTPDWEALK